MRATTKIVPVRGNEYAVSVRPVQGSIYADVLVDGVKVGLVQQYSDKSGYRFYANLEGSARTYGVKMLREVMSNEAWKVAEDAAFEAEVAAYDGPMDNSDATTECVDCGGQVLIRTPELARGHAPYTDCPANVGTTFPGHRVSGSVYNAWQHQNRVILAVKIDRARKEA